MENNGNIRKLKLTSTEYNKLDESSKKALKQKFEQLHTELSGNKPEDVPEDMDALLTELKNLYDEINKLDITGIYEILGNLLGNLKAIQSALPEDIKRGTTYKEHTKTALQRTELLEFAIINEHDQAIIDGQKNCLIESLDNVKNNIEKYIKAIKAEEIEQDSSMKVESAPSVASDSTHSIENGPQNTSSSLLENTLRKLEGDVVDSTGHPSISTEQDENIPDNKETEAATPQGAKSEQDSNSSITKEPEAINNSNPSGGAKQGAKKKKKKRGRGRGNGNTPRSASPILKADAGGTPQEIDRYKDISLKIETIINKLYKKVNDLCFLAKESKAKDIDIYKTINSYFDKVFIALSNFIEQCKLTEKKMRTSANPAPRKSEDDLRKEDHDLFTVKTINALNGLFMNIQKLKVYYIAVECYIAGNNRCGHSFIDSYAGTNISSIKKKACIDVKIAREEGNCKARISEKQSATPEQIKSINWPEVLNDTVCYVEKFLDLFALELENIKLIEDFKSPNIKPIEEHKTLKDCSETIEKIMLVENICTVAPEFVKSLLNNIGETSVNQSKVTVNLMKICEHSKARTQQRIDLTNKLSLTSGIYLTKYMLHDKISNSSMLKALYKIIKALENSNNAEKMANLLKDLNDAGDNHRHNRNENHYTSEQEADEDMERKVVPVALKTIDKILKLDISIPTEPMHQRSEGDGQEDLPSTSVDSSQNALINSDDKNCIWEVE